MIHAKIKPILTIPIKSVKSFPGRSDDWTGEYPALIKPWIGGVRAYWLDDLQAFQLQDGRVLRVEGIEPFVPEDHMGKPAVNLLGEFWEKNETYEHTLEQILNNEPSDSLDFYVFDAEMQEPALDRAKYYFSLPRQYERHTRIAEVYQVMTHGGFRTYLDGWRRNFNGALVVEPSDPWLATEYEVTELIGIP